MTIVYKIDKTVVFTDKFKTFSLRELDCQIVDTKHFVLFLCHNKLVQSKKKYFRNKLTNRSVLIS